MFTYICMYTHTSIYTYVSILYVYIYIIYIYVYLSIYLYIHVCIYIHIYIYTHTHTHLYIHTYIKVLVNICWILLQISTAPSHVCWAFLNTHTGWPRPTGYLIFTGHLPQKRPIISGSFAKSDLQLRASMGLRHPVSRAFECVRCMYTRLYKMHFCLWNAFFLCIYMFLRIHILMIKRMRACVV